MTPENDGAERASSDAGYASDDGRADDRERRDGPAGAESDAATDSDAGADAASAPESSGLAEESSLPLKTLAVLNWLGDEGVRGVESRLNDVLDDDLDVTTEQVKIGYAEQETVASQFRAEDRAGARVLLSEPLVGNVLVVFPMESANKAAALMLQRAVDDLSSVSTEMGRDALTELCNMMANGFVDEWATLFETTIDTGSPVAVQDPERTLVARILKQYEVGLFIRSRLRIPRHDVDAAIYMFPGKEEFLTKLSAVDLGVIE
ncbi:chemotaxis protein CheC [Halorussus gelatinilyticus]|uniref:Chemotaxis protein CheC n=1 Tax=Halorussus gelatinilyticus TaxID=2937524 RepID=A0A8U0IFL0_9EURY|nr:chemotaxis protein CheC [Halorussus gelatinilyticus]UPV99480.1 chemotaxis protein CheC [Halorussus gelatinilyticus]